MDSIILKYGNSICPKEWTSTGVNEMHHKIYYCYSGDVLYKDSTKTFHLKSNHLYIFPMNTPYQMNIDGHELFHVMWFHIDYSIPIVSDVVEIEIDTDTIEFDLIKSLEKAITKKPKVVHILINALMNEIMLCYEIRPCYTFAIMDVINFINLNIKDSISNEQLAKMIGYNKKYLIRIFKNQIGISPHQYIIKTKMNCAKKYLSEGNSIKDVASMSGYDNPNLFSRDFKKYFGMSPSKYKESTLSP